MSGQEKALEVVIVYNLENNFGLKRDAEILEEGLVQAARALKVPMNKIRIVDPRQPPIACDLCIHLEVPYAVWFGWSRTTILFVNPEWWQPAWNSYKDSVDAWVFRSNAARDRFVKEGIVAAEKSCVVRWRTNGLEGDVFKNPMSNDANVGWVWFLAGSHSKREAAKKILPLWKEEFLPLTVYSTAPLDLSGALAKNVRCIARDLPVEERARIAAFYPGHVCISSAEGFGYTAAESEQIGAFTLLNNLDVYTESFSDCSGVVWLNTEHVVKDLGLHASFTDSESIVAQLQVANDNLKSVNLADLRLVRRSQMIQRFTRFEKDLQSLFRGLVDTNKANSKLPKHMPPLLNASDCPPISVITLIHGRQAFLDLAFHNLILTDYPRNKIEWVVVDDSPAAESGSDKILKFSERFYPGKVLYVPLPKRCTVGRKRNIGCKRASNDIILMMDDDDHYPQTSFRRRVAWLLGSVKKNVECTVCTTIALYDLNKGVSAVNVPPYNLSLAERCSEATLTFKKSFWEQKNFPEIMTSEGEEFLSGREDKILEIPPQQIIVAMNHSQNSSGRRLPGDDAKPGCFWGFPKEFIVFLHKLVGVEVEEEKTTSVKRKS